MTMFTKFDKFLGRYEIRISKWSEVILETKMEKIVWMFRIPTVQQNLEIMGKDEIGTVNSKLMWIED